MSDEENTSDNVVTSSSVLKALACQVLQVLNTNSLKLKLTMSNEKDAIIENSKEDVNDPVTTSSLEAALSGKITATRAEIIANEIRNGDTTLVHMSTCLFTAGELWDEWHNGTNGNPPLKHLEKMHGSKWRNDKKGYGANQIFSAMG